jgi:mRNA interferase HigB
MRIIALRALREFWEQSGRADAEKPLKTWHAVTRQAVWLNPVEVKQDFNSADVLKGGRVIFDIGGNKYRLVVHIRYAQQIVFIRFIGDHRDYDRINPDTV